jgi:hypothetical protein
MVERRRRTLLGNEVETIPSFVAVRFLSTIPGSKKLRLAAGMEKCCHFSLDAGPEFIDGYLLLRLRRLGIRQQYPEVVALYSHRRAESLVHGVNQSFLLRFRIEESTGPLQSPGLHLYPYRCLALNGASRRRRARFRQNVQRSFRTTHLAMRPIWIRDCSDLLKIMEWNLRSEAISLGW